MKILVWLSGWVDSAVAAHLLMKEGHEIVAGFMLNYLDEDNPNCTTKLDLESFHAVRKHLGIEAYEIFDYRTEYEDRILNYIYQWYQQGITPNPDVYCNSLVKFDLFRKEAIAMGFDAIATGHYARITQTPSALPHPPSQGEYSTKWVYHLLKWIDNTKDQSYFLSQLDQTQLSQAIFPLWGMDKSEVRKLAHHIWLPNADRPDSQGLCFVGNISMQDFLMDKIWPKPGIIIDLEWKQVGAHNGAYLYTIGQRRNLYLPFQSYVADVNVTDNIVTVARVWQENALLTKQITMVHPHRISWSAPVTWSYTCKIRYRQEAQNCMLELVEHSWELVDWDSYELWSMTYKLIFDEPIIWVANGQIVVIYDGDEVVGSWVIQKN